MTMQHTSVTDALHRCFAEQRFDDLAALYHEDATFELHVGAEHERCTGRAAITARYAADFAVRPEFRRWDVRPAPWGAVVEAAAVQRHGATDLLFRWTHLLTVEDGRVVSDTIYCTGGVPT